MQESNIDIDEHEGNIMYTDEDDPQLPGEYEISLADDDTEPSTIKNDNSTK